MEYLNLEETTQLKSKIFTIQKLYLFYMFLYLIGIIIQVTAFVVSPKGVLNLFYLMIAPICTIGLIYCTNKLYDFRASAYNRFGSEGIYHHLTVFWGNKKLPIAALSLSLILIFSSFVNFFKLEMPTRQALIETQNNIETIRVEAQKTSEYLIRTQRLVNKLGNKDFNSEEQRSFLIKELQECQKGLQEQLYQIANQLNKIKSANSQLSKILDEIK